MEITERFDVQYYKNIIKEKNTYENATSAQYVERNGTEVYVHLTRMDISYKKLSHLLMR